MTDPITDQQLDELVALAEQATKGEWITDSGHTSYPASIICPSVSRNKNGAPKRISYGGPPRSYYSGVDTGEDKANAESIAALHNYFPALLARLKSAEADNAQLHLMADSAAGLMAENQRLKAQLESCEDESHRWSLALDHLT